MSGAQFQYVPFGNVNTVWSVVGTGDGDGNGDILWRDTSGDSAIWFMNGAQAQCGPVATPRFKVDFRIWGESSVAWTGQARATRSRRMLVIA
jgi:hypothetical protein